MATKLPKLQLLAILMLTLILATGCSAANPQAFSVFERGSAAMETESFTFAAALDQSSWQSLYEKIHAHRLPPPQLPEVDWQKNLIVMVASGWKPSAGYGVDIPRMELKSETLRVFVRTSEPPADSIRATVMTQPYALALVERPAALKVVEFVDGEGQVLQRLDLSPL
ncbi:protease complex subunit PrcB family protein [Geoalkalibacter sp.]|uniref:protease complex subunit PrcB family protein n=1 Tax=Geoalkalibacter sp. TaxID=3041440 RepID=UPI00272DCC58|nr:protease complex subunit PrcB family protein [Geoalkalibacter sp.]